MYMNSQNSNRLWHQWSDSQYVVSFIAGSLQISCLSILLTLSSASAVNITFDGELFDRPCQIDSGSLNQTVQFKPSTTEDFHFSSGKGPETKFSIRLNNCNTNTVWRTVKLRFYGDKESAMKERSEYFLKVTGVNSGKLAIGLLDTDGVTSLKLGDVHNRGGGSLIGSDILQLDFKAFVQITPDALVRKNITSGSYASTANFELLYE